MPLTVSVGLSKKSGLPNYGSVGASCNVQFELDANALQHDLSGFQQQVRNAYVACSQSVNDELARHVKGQGDERPNGRTVDGSVTEPPSGSTQNGIGHRATEKQVEYARQLAGQINGLDVRRLEDVAGKMFGKPLADLSILEASGLIDTLKDIKAGRISPEHPSNGAAT